MGGSAWTNQTVYLIVITEEVTGQSGIFGYSPSLGTGNLIFSVAAAAGTDPYGNAYVAGVTTYATPDDGTYVVQQAGTISFFQTLGVIAATIGSNATAEMILSSGTTSANTRECILSLVPGSATVPSQLQIDNADIGITPIQNAQVPVPASGSYTQIVPLPDGHLQYVSTTVVAGGDANTYDVGRGTIALTSTMTVSVNGFNTITDGDNAFTFPVGIGSYRFRARIIYLPSGTAGTPTFELTSPGFDSGSAIFTLQYNGIASGFARFTTASGFTASWASVANTTPGTTVYVAVDIEGQAVFSATGNLAAKVSTNAGSNIVIQEGSFFELLPIS